MTRADDPRHDFLRAAIEWAAGARGQVLVDAAAQALADGLDSPALRILAGAPRVAADEEAIDLASAVFDELGLDVECHLSEAAILQAARVVASDLLSGYGSPRDATAIIYAMSCAAGHPVELANFSGFDDWYDMLDQGIVSGRVEDVDAAVITSARELAQGGG